TASEFVAQDSRDLIVLAVGGAYLQALAARARLQLAQAQIDSAKALYGRATERRASGLGSPAEADRAEIRVLTEQQRLVALTADEAERLPSLNVNADYGVTRASSSATHATFTVAATLRIPVWEGARVDGDIGKARASLADRRAELENLRADVQADVRKAYL